MREIYGSGPVSPRIHISKYKNFGREGELSDGLSGRVIQRLGTRVRFPGSAHNTFGFLAQTDEQIDLGGWENLALVATVD